MYILTWWDPFPAPRMDSTTFSQWWTAHPGGWRPYRCTAQTRRLLQPPSLQAGLPASVCLTTSPLTGATILFGPLVRIVTAVGHQTPPHYCLPLTSQQDGRESTLPAQGRPAGPRSRQRLDFLPPLGLTRDAGSSQRGLQLIFSGVGMWSPPGDSWSSRRCAGAAAGGLSGSSQSGPFTHPREEFINFSPSRVHSSCPG